MDEWSHAGPGPRGARRTSTRLCTDAFGSVPAVPAVPAVPSGGLRGGTGPSSRYQSGTTDTHLDEGFDVAADAIGQDSMAPISIVGCRGGARRPTTRQQSIC